MNKQKSHWISRRVSHNPDTPVVDILTEPSGSRRLYTAAWPVSDRQFVRLSMHLESEGLPLKPIRTALTLDMYIDATSISSCSSLLALRSTSGNLGTPRLAGNDEIQVPRNTL